MYRGHADRNIWKAKTLDFLGERMKETRCTDSGIVEREAIFPEENGDMPGYGDTAVCGDDEEYEENAGELD